MIQNLILQTDRLQAELIVSDIASSGRAFLRALALRPGSDPASLATEAADILADARRLAVALGGNMLLAGFRQEGPVEMPTPENPPAGFTFLTGFVHLTGSIPDLAKSVDTTDTALPFRRVLLTVDRIKTHQHIHQEGMRGVPNVPTLTEDDVRKQMESDRLYLIERSDGTAIGLVDLTVDPDNKTAELEEIAILPEWRSHGIGRQAIAQLSAELADEGIESLVVLVATINTGALRLYRHLGFGQERFHANWFRQPLDRKDPIGAIHTAAELTADLRKLGVEPGMMLLVHSSLKSIGWIPGGAVALIEALREAVGPDGTIIMPAQSGDNSDPAHWIAPPVPKAYWPVIREAMPPYDPRITPTRAIGKVAEIFRTYPNVIRSLHPSCSFAALGPHATAITCEHPLDSALGEQSPNQKMVDLGAFVLQIGVDFDTCTLMHLAEYQTRCRLRTRQGSSVTIDGQRTWQYYEDIQMNSDEFIEPGRLLESRGLVRTGRVGESSCRLFHAADAVTAAADWLKANRMRRLDESDRDWLLDYLGQEPAYNLFLIGDIENFGFNTPFQDLMAYHRSESPDRVDSVLLRYHNNFIVYSDRDDFATGPVLSGLAYPDLNVLSAKKSVISRLAPYLTDYRFREMFLMKKSVQAIAIASASPSAGPTGLPADTDISQATVADVHDLAAFLHSIEEFRQINTSLEQRTEEMTRSLGGTGSRYVLIRENGVIVACAGTTAENSHSAMVVGVATAPDKRSRGYATRLVGRLCTLHQAEGRDYLCLFYDNPAAGIIYRRLGFTDVGTWVMATPPKRL